MKKAKSYIQPDSKAESVSEPVAIYVNAREAILKMEAVEEIMSLQGEELLNKALRYLRNLRGSVSAVCAELDEEETYMVHESVIDGLREIGERKAGRIQGKQKTLQDLIDEL